MAKMKTIASVSVGLGLVVTSIAAVAGPNSKSPFASNKKKAWETSSEAAPSPATLSASPYKPPVNLGGGAEYRPPTQYNMPSAQPQNYQPQSYQPNTNQPNTNKPAYQMPSANYQTLPVPVPVPRGSGGYYPGKQPSNVAPAWTTAPNQTPDRPAFYNKAFAKGVYAQDGNTQTIAGQYPQNYQTQNVQLRGPSNPSFADRLGFGNIQTELSGHAKIGIAGADLPSQDISFESVADIDVRGEINAITDGGLEYGAGLRVRAQRDKYRRGFGGRVGDCPATNPACASAVAGANTRNVKGHTGQFFTGGPADIKETEIALEGAYVFLRSAYGDFVLGRDDGAAYLFSLGAPSVAMVGASNSRVDYTGLDSVKTYNDASGFAEKISYTSPRLLGDNVGVGVQFGLSYAPSAKACGVDYCVRENGAGAGDIFAPEIKNIIEAGVSLDRKFSNGLAVELTGTYAHGSEKTGNAVFSNLSTWGAGLELKYADLTLGSSYLKSNNGFAANGDYTAYDIGVQWKPSNWGFSASYGHATDDIARLSSNQGVLAASYDFGTFTLGSGVQYIKRKVPVNTGAGVVRQSQDAVALFIEAGIKF